MPSHSVWAFTPVRAAKPAVTPCGSKKNQLVASVQTTVPKNADVDREGKNEEEDRKEGEEEAGFLSVHGLQGTHRDAACKGLAQPRTQHTKHRNQGQSFHIVKVAFHLGNGHVANPFLGAVAPRFVQGLAGVYVPLQPGIR